MSAHGYIIGADGGGSKTAMLLARTDGSEVARLTAGASNPTDLGIENSASFLTETVARLRRSQPGLSITAARWRKPPSRCAPSFWASPAARTRVSAR